MEENPMRHYIWEGSVGVVLKPRRNSKTGEYFWSYRLTRFAGEDADGQKRYHDSFSSRETEAVGKALTRALSYMDQNDPESAFFMRPARQAA